MPFLKRYCEYMRPVTEYHAYLEFERQMQGWDEDIEFQVIAGFGVNNVSLLPGVYNLFLPLFFF